MRLRFCSFDRGRFYGSPFASVAHERCHRKGQDGSKNLRLEIRNCRQKCRMLSPYFAAHKLCPSINSTLHDVDLRCCCCCPQFHLHLPLNVRPVSPRNHETLRVVFVFGWFNQSEPAATVRTVGSARYVYGRLCRSATSIGSMGHRNHNRPNSSRH